MTDMRVWKYDLPLQESFELEIPDGAKFLTVDEQYGQGRMWWLVDTEAKPVTRTFLTVGTGHPMPVADVYLGSYHLQEGRFVFHVFQDIGLGEALT